MQFVVCVFLSRQQKHPPTLIWGRLKPYVLMSCRVYFQGRRSWVYCSFLPFVRTLTSKDKLSGPSHMKTQQLWCIHVYLVCSLQMMQSKRSISCTLFATTRVLWAPGTIELCAKIWKPARFLEGGRSLMILRKFTTILFIFSWTYFLHNMFQFLHNLESLQSAVPKWSQGSSPLVPKKTPTPAFAFLHLGCPCIAVWCANWVSVPATTMESRHYAHIWSTTPL